MLLGKASRKVGIKMQSQSIMIKTLTGLQSFASGLQSACLIRRFLAGQVVAMFDEDVLKMGKITFESIDERGHRTRMPITEKMLGVQS